MKEIIKRVFGWFKFGAINVIIAGEGIDIEIDTLTPCLVHRKTKRLVDTFYFKVGEKELKNVEKKNGWKFSWSKIFKDGYDIYMLKDIGSSSCQGLIAVKEAPANQAIEVGFAESAPHNLGVDGEHEGTGGHLFAIAVKLSKEKKYNGFIYFTAKTSLFQHYKDTLGAERIGNSQTMFISESKASIILEKYYPGGEKTVD